LHHRVTVFRVLRSRYCACLQAAEQYRPYNAPLNCPPHLTQVRSLASWFCASCPRRLRSR
jgi:hypothetical protein